MLHKGRAATPGGDQAGTRRGSRADHSRWESFRALLAGGVGSCGLAPAVVYDHDVAGKVTPQGLRERLGNWKSHVS